MCLNLTYTEARLWMKRANDIVHEAMSKAKLKTPDPLLTAYPNLSSLVSAMVSIKIRHGYLVEDALIDAIGKVPNWEAKRVRISISTGNADLDCIAFNRNSGKLYVFECKRGNSYPDYSSRASIDNRLDKVKASISNYTSSVGWNPKSHDFFILSFYGCTWKSKYDILDKKTIETKFEPCVVYFINEYMRYAELKVRDMCGNEIFGEDKLYEDDNIFYKLERELEEIEGEILFTEDGAKFV